MVNAWYNEDVEEHREWKDNFGFTESDNIKDNKDIDYQGPKLYPVIEVSVPNKSYKRTEPEWINPVTGDELGEQEVTINVEEHIGLYYFETKAEYNSWVSSTIDTLEDAVGEPDGVETGIAPNKRPDLPDWLAKYQT
tara:strand:+ start:395 stop:805 length:411 start_codon:yes stop_codon:yes gene_type:complete